MIRSRLTHLLKKSPLARFIIIPAAFLLFLGILFSINLITNKKPELLSLDPAIGGPGEVIRIHGKNFGSDNKKGWIKIAGDRLSANTVLEWDATTIMIVLPETIQDGLVYVNTGAGKSNPLIFANKSNIPIKNIAQASVGVPRIKEFSNPRIETGKRLIIYGKNFGLARDDSQVLFTWKIDPALPLSTQNRISQASIACSETSFDYEFWSDQEIRVRVPDGAGSGNVFIKTLRGLSNGEQVQIVNQPGEKLYTEQRTYTVSLNVDITDVTAGDGNMFLLRIPRPVTTAAQRNIEITRSDPTPYLENYRGTILHQFENLRSGKTLSVSHTFLVTAYGIQTEILANQVRPYTDTDSPLYLMYTASDPAVPSNNADILIKASEIIGKEKNPYRRAKLIYTWITDSITYKEHDDPNRSVIEALSEQTGSAWDMAILFTALCRASGIPAIPIAGMVVDANRESRVHWWAEFYLENFGWVPVDPALGTGNPFPTAQENPTEWYFGNMDPYHIVFDRGWTDQKPMTQKSRVVQRSRSYAFQPIWEESGGNLEKYTSFWGDPRITGVY
ncbi:MAG TPA: hypothetical protein GXZ47_04675 [Treponema sp.]|nr:hypothetical protein [Treponema sp.]